jgi:hypothetical protein
MLAPSRHRPSTFWPFTSSPGSGRHRLPIAGLLVLLVLGLALVIALLPSRVSAPSSGAGALPARGTVAAITSGAQPTVIVRVPGDTIERVAMTAGRTMVTGNGHLLSLSDVQIGDTLVRRSAGRLADTSQTWTNMVGIVALAPDPKGDAMTVRVSRSNSILVVLDPATRITGAGLSANQRDLIAEGDQVQMTGALNRRLGVMADTTSITVVKPKRQRG